MRAEPDVALVADPQTGAVFTESYATANGHTKIVDSWIGGTSLAAPLMAGIAALADQQSNRAHGFLNPQLYGLAGSSSLHDIVPSSGTLAVLRNGLDPKGHVITRLRGIDRDSTLVTAAGLGSGDGAGEPERAAPAQRAALERSPRNRATASMWCVCGNMSTGRTASSS